MLQTGPTSCCLFCDSWALLFFALLWNIFQNEYKPLSCSSFGFKVTAGAIRRSALSSVLFTEKCHFLQFTPMRDSEFCFCASVAIQPESVSSAEYFKLKVNPWQAMLCRISVFSLQNQISLVKTRFAEKSELAMLVFFNYQKITTCRC